MKNSKILKKPKVLFFDINETILDMSPLKAEINKLLGNDLFDFWFTKLLHESLVMTITGTYESFSKLAINSLKQLYTMQEMKFTDNLFNKLADILSSLPPYPDVVNTLEILKEKGYLIVALSNSSKDLLEKQLMKAKIDYLFDKQISVELFQKYKPHMQVYQEAANLSNSKAEECMLVAAHDWDVFGALNSGLRAVFVKRSGKCVYFLPLKPELEVENLFVLTERL